MGLGARDSENKFLSPQAPGFPSPYKKVKRPDRNSTGPLEIVVKEAAQTRTSLSV